MVWFGREETRGGRLTLGLARIVGIPHFVVERSEDGGLMPPPQHLVDWLHDRAVGTLLVAGNRESHEPGIGQSVESYLREALRAVNASA
jgi:hypothetical protein